jgi:hypothetical protein
LTILKDRQLRLYLLNSSRKERKFAAYRHIELLWRLVVTGFDVLFSLV